MSDRATAFAPGRVNLIGEHTDYNDGLALPFAIGEGVTVEARALPGGGEGGRGEAGRGEGGRGEGGRLEAHAVDLGETDAFELSNRDPASGWRSFVRGVAAELRDAGYELTGAELRITGNVPRGAGLSSSAALEVALALALLALSGAGEPDRTELAKLCSKVEREWVGAQTGLLDQLASLFGERERALRIDFRTLDVRPVALELGDYKLVTLDSGEHHDIASSGYNERRAECAEACRELGIASLRDATLEMAARLNPHLEARVRHVVSENARVEAAVDALRRRDLISLGELLDASHVSLRDCYEVSTPAVEAAWRRLHDAGALGARIVGGGFGGHVLGLLAPDAAVPSGAIEVRPGPGARVLSQ